MATNKKKRAELLAARPKDYVGPRDYAAKTIKHRYENRKSKVDHLVDLPSENDCYDPFVSDDDEHGSARFMKLDLAQLAEWKSSRNNPNQGHCDECDRDGYAVRLKRGKRVLNLCVRHACELIIREAQDSFHLREEAA